MDEIIGTWPENDYRFIQHSIRGRERRNHKYTSRKMGSGGKWIYTYGKDTSRDTSNRVNNADKDSYAERSLARIKEEARQRVNLAYNELENKKNQKVLSKVRVADSKLRYAGRKAKAKTKKKIDKLIKKLGELEVKYF